MEDFYVDLTPWMYDNDERLVIEKEIFDRAVEHGAKVDEGREGWCNAFEMEDIYKYYGVDSGFTCFSDLDCGYGVLTLRQVREKYPLPSDVRESEEITPKELKPNIDIVKHPPHYMMFPEHNLEVKHINKRLLDNIEASDMQMSYYEAGWFQQAMQYLLRCYAKGGWQDIEKAIETLNIAVESRKGKS